MATFNPTGLTLPEFFIVGPPKIGKSALAASLRSHEDIAVPHQSPGTNDWFQNDANWRRGFGIYALQFNNDADEGRLVGDVISLGRGQTPRRGRASSFNRATPSPAKILFRLNRMAPAAKVIVLLRDPTELWLSNFGARRDRSASNVTLQRYFDRFQEALSFGTHHGFLRTLFLLFPTTQVYIEFTERMKGDETVRTKLIIDFLGKDSTKPFTPVVFKGLFSENDVFRNKINAIFKPGLPSLKVFLDEQGYDGNQVDNWTRPAPAGPTTTDDLYITAVDVQLDTTTVGAGVLANDFDVNGDPVTAILDATPGNGTVSMNTDGTFSYLPNSLFNGTDTFTYHANDGVLSSSPLATVTMKVKPTTDPPVANDGNYLVAPNGSLTDPLPGLLENDTKVQGTLVAQLDASPGNGGATVNADGSFTYVPNSNFLGTDLFTYHNNDGTNNSNIATVTVRVDF